MLADLMVGFEEVSRQTYREVESVEEEEALHTGTEAVPELEAVPLNVEQGEEAGVVRETF